MYVEDIEDNIINFGVHSRVYTIYVEDIEDVQMYMYLFQEDDPDKHKSWFGLGMDIGLEIVDDEEVEAEVDEIEADEEVAQIYEDAKQREDVFGEGCGGTASTSSVRQDPHHTHPNCNPS